MNNTLSSQRNNCLPEHSPGDKPLHVAITQNTFLPQEKARFAELPDPLKIELASTLPPDASMSLLVQAGHRAHQLIQPPSFGTKIKELLHPGYRQFGQQMKEEARLQAKLSKAIILTHGERMQTPHHNADFKNRLPTDQSIQMHLLAQALHLDPVHWEAIIRDHADRMKPIIGPGKFPFSSLHVVSHRASDQLKEIAEHPEIGLDRVGAEMLSATASKLSHLCLQLDRLDMIDHSQVFRHFPTGRNRHHFYGDWHNLPQ